MIKLRSMIMDKPENDGTYMVTDKKNITFFELKDGGWEWPDEFRFVKIIDTFWIEILPPNTPYKFEKIKDSLECDNCWGCAGE